jgi:hypothetical protein
MNRWMKLGVGVLVLGMGSLSTAAQRPRPSDPPRDLEGRCACSAGGVECLFGSAGGCSVNCEDNACRCESAWCFLGFPRASRCYCETGMAV